MGGNWQLKLNGHDRFKERDTRCFTRTQVWQHHTGYGGVKTLGHNDADLTGGDTGIYWRMIQSRFILFALKPEEHQPSGTWSFL